MEKDSVKCGTATSLSGLLQEHGRMDADEAAEAAPELLSLVARHRAACLLLTNALREFDEAVVFDSLESDVLDLVGEAAKVRFYHDPRGATTRLYFPDNTSNSLIGGVTIDAPATMLGPLLEDHSWVDEVAASSEAARQFVYKVDLDERGCFYAHVERIIDGKCVFSLNNEYQKYDVALEHEDTEEERNVFVEKSEASSDDEAIAVAKEQEELGDAWFIMHVGEVTVYGDLDLVTDGFMSHRFDVDGLKEHLINLGMLPKDAELKLLNPGVPG